MYKQNGPVSLGDRMRVARALFGVTQQDVAVQLGVSRVRICQLERGALRNPDMARAMLMAIFLSGVEQGAKGG